MGTRAQRSPQTLLKTFPRYGMFLNRVWATFWSVIQWGKRAVISNLFCNIIPRVPLWLPNTDQKYFHFHISRPRFNYFLPLVPCGRAALNMEESGQMVLIKMHGIPEIQITFPIKIPPHYNTKAYVNVSIKKRLPGTDVALKLWAMHTLITVNVIKDILREKNS